MHSVAVLNHAEPLPSVTRKNLTQVAKRLARSRTFLAVRYDAESGRVSFLRVPEQISVEEPAAGGSGRGKRHRPAPAAPVYEGEGSDRISRGSVRVAGNGRWSGSIEVPADGDPAALLTLEREGDGAMLEPTGAALVVPDGEADAFIVLLNGLFAQAKRDRVLAGLEDQR